MNKFRKILEQSLSQASSGSSDKALQMLDDGITEALRESDSKWIARLAKNAGLVSENRGELEKAEQYYLKAIEHDYSDPYIHYSVGCIYERLNQGTLARSYFDASRSLATERNDQDLLDILDRVN